MKTLAWIFRNVILPLVPVFAGVTIRSIHRDAFDLSSLSSSELSFSMAMLCLIISMSASRCTDRVLADSLTLMYHFGVFVFLAFFSWSILLEYDIQSSLQVMSTTIEARLKAGGSVEIADLPARLHEFEGMLDRVRVITVVLSLCIIPLSIYSNRKYHLEEL